jgi:hypothetical protein
MLVLLLAIEDADAAIDCAAHIWYSAQILNPHLDLLNTVVRLLVEDMCQKSPKRLKESFWLKPGLSIHRHVSSHITSHSSRALEGGGAISQS